MVTGTTYDVKWLTAGGWVCYNYLEFEIIFKKLIRRRFYEVIRLTSYFDFNG